MAAANASLSAENSLSELISRASARKNPACGYVGELLPAEVFAYLVQQGGLLVDVRTLPEWQFVGLPELSGCKGQLAAISWKIYPEMAENPHFAAQLAETGIAKESPIFFMCRGGGRSSAAANAMAAAGYSCCFNVATGFEGEVDAEGHRGRKSGWQGTGLPWKH
ncbi:MAG: rhodanese-like domain-containing protein [Alphaproteobacteria bacterium]|nr:rhodanese-like domain-containing protein [Alphaproteobacteria bacterium]